VFGLGFLELALGFTILLVVGTIGAGILRMIVRSSNSLPRPDDRALMLEERTARLEENLVTLTEQVERVVAEQEFTNKLLGERAGARTDRA
jgi:hypothetical protein